MVQKMAQPLISQEFQSGLCSDMKLHSRQLQHVTASIYEVPIESDKNYGNARCFKKGCLKIQYRGLINAK